MAITHISELLKAGSLDRRIQILGLTYTKVEGEARPVYAELLNVRASKTEGSGIEEDKIGSVVSTATVTFTIRYNSQIVVETKNYEALRLAEVMDEPVYLLDLGGQIMYDLFGNPLISIEDTEAIQYDIVHVEELGRKVGMVLTCERWR